jgi:hypothetical protein
VSAQGGGLRAGIALATLATACDSDTAWFPFDTDDGTPPPTAPLPGPDLDNDGYTVADGDCNDDDPGVGPDHDAKFVESCDAVDNDCDGYVDVNEGTGERACAREAEFDQSLKVDLLFVVDTTAPMVNYLTNLASGAHSVLTSLAGQEYLDSHIGVVTMDAASPFAGQLLSYEGESFISGSDVGPGTSRSMFWAEQFLTSGFTANPVSIAPEEGRLAAQLALGLDLGSGVEELNPGFLREDAHLVIVFLSSNEDQTVAPTINQFETELIFEKGSLSEVTIHAVVQTGELDCYEQSEPAQKGYSYQTLAQHTAGTVLSICQDMTSGFFEAMGQNSAYEGLETEFDLGATVVTGTVAVTIIDNFGNHWPLDEFALENDRTLIITSDPPPSAGSTIFVEYEIDPFSL